MGNKAKIHFEKFFPFIFSIVITVIFYYLKKENLLCFDDEKLKELKKTDLYLILSTSFLAVLITHKSLILSIDNNKGFKKLLTGVNISKRFFSYMNCVIFTSTISIIYSLLIKFCEKLFLLEFIVFVSSLLVLQFIRFVWVFNIVFEKSILPNNDSEEK